MSKKKKYFSAIFLKFCPPWVSIRNRCVIGCWIGSSDINLVPSKLSDYFLQLFANKIFDLVPNGHSWMPVEVTTKSQ